MAHTNETENYSLSQFLATDKPAWLTDYNTDMIKIDSALHGLQDEIEQSDGDISSITERVTQNETDIADNKSRLDSVEDRTTALEDRATIDENNITNNTNRIGSIASDVEDLKNGQGLADNSVGTNNLKDRSVTTDKIGLGAVTTDEILNGTIQYEDLSSDCINHFNPSQNNQYKQMIVNALYPIGSVYLSMGVNPNSAFGGSWTRITGGVLYTANNDSENGTTTGSDSVTISADNLPRHRHSVAPTGSVSTSASGGTVYTDNNPTWNITDPLESEPTLMPVYKTQILVHPGTLNVATSVSPTGTTAEYSLGNEVPAKYFGHKHSVDLSSLNISSSLTLNTVYTDYQYSASPSAISIKQSGVKVSVWKRTA